MAYLQVSPLGASREETWRGHGIRKRSVPWNLPEPSLCIRYLFAQRHLRKMNQILDGGICNSRLRRCFDFWGLLTKVSRTRSTVSACSFRSEQAATLLEFLVPLTNCFVRRWFCVVLGRNLRGTVTIDSVLANSKTRNAFSSPVFVMSLHHCPLAVKPGNTP
jgi:hypothetical protein